MRFPNLPRIQIEFKCPLWTESPKCRFPIPHILASSYVGCNHSAQVPTMSQLDIRKGLLTALTYPQPFPQSGYEEIIKMQSKFLCLFSQQIFPKDI